MQFILQYPEPHGPDGDLLAAGPLGEVAQAAERAGFHGFSLTEHPAPGSRWLASGGHQTLDPFVALGHVAAVTERLRLLTYLSVAPYRNPLLLAKAAATLDRLSGGRFTLGLGAGYLKGEFHALGVDFDERNALFDETLDVLPGYWSGEPFSYEGRHFSARDVVCRPRPVQSPLPIWLGGNARLTRRRVAERAHGWMPLSGGAQLAQTARTPGFGGVPELAQLITELYENAAAAGRTDPIDIVHSYQDEGLTTPAAEPDGHREAFAELAKAGVTWVVVSSGTHSAAATFEFIDAFGATYLR
ncbi:LLM class F420-dependent oxidoreductase [Streptomyces sp. NBC_01352]|uniref:LLM class F420-dependent oxidoreductase n=1 Tax=unclassified Streptomyces TaxID=2593676 RepID=UPI00225A796B|nr:MULTISPECIES: LLM class F420-dependent oxidoreductase [unclassified Streptomyces]MCX4704251.1 LLM class F420-dependent oxidoreductase [Streptomyces sp. NBC_01373]